jgi:hypothetical protein
MSQRGEMGLAHSASAFDDALAASDVHVAGFPADVSLVDLDVATDLATHFVLHGKTNAVQHEPSGFLSHADSAGQFIAADSILGVGDEPHSD